MEKQTSQSKGSHIIVKDYIYAGNLIFGTFYQVTDGVDTFILDDGDIFTLKELEDEGYEYIRLHSKEIIENFKDKFKEIKQNQIPFNEWSKERIAQGRKFMTSRHKRYDKDARVLKILDKMPWGLIKDRFWQLEGANSPEELQRIIEDIYHRPVLNNEMFYPHIGDFR